MRWMILMLVLLTSFSGIQAQEAWRYGYVTRNAEGELVLVTIDPVTLRSRTATISNSQAWLESATASPDGRWLLLWFNDAPRFREWRDVASLLRLVNMETGEIRDITQVPYMHEFTGYDEYYPLWSPDSHYFTHFDFIYSIDTEEFLPLNVADPIILARMWSPDSRYLAVADSICRANSCYGVELNIYDVPEMTTTHSQTYSYAVDACNLAWSTDQRNIVFDIKCSYWNSGLDSYGEVIQWDLATNEVSPLTSYTIPPWERGFSRDGVAEYSTLWIDAVSLLVSVVHYESIGSEDGLIPNPSSLVVGTALYHFPSPEWEWLSEEYVSEWAHNPTTEQIAYQARTLDTSDPTRYRWEQERVEVATFNQGELTPQYTTPIGCDLQWSPDGAWLVYHSPRRDVIGRYDCNRWRTLIFVDGSTGQVSEIPLPVNDVRFAGWLQTPEEFTPFYPMGTPTPQPTPTPILGFG